MGRATGLKTGEWIASLVWVDERGTTHRLSRRRASQKAALAALKTLQGIKRGDVSSGDSAGATVATVLADWIAAGRTRTERPISARTERDYLRQATLIAAAIGPLRAVTIRRPDIVRMIEAINGDRQRQQCYILAKAALTPYVRAADPTEHPFPSRATPGVKKKREILDMSLDQIKSFSATVTQREPEHAAIYILAISTGLRQAELLGLRWRDVADDALTVSGSLDEATRTLKGTKTGKARPVDITPQIAEILAAHRARNAKRGMRVGRDDYVFQNSAKRPLLASNLRREWSLARVRLGLATSVRLYDLRHAHATALLAAGVHPKIVQDRLGHESFRLTMDTYSHVVPGMQAQARPAIDALFSSPAATPAPLASRKTSRKTPKKPRKTGSRNR